jgi:hypothetical protein
MVDPHTSMSLTAVLVLTVVVLVTVGGWLWVVFRVGSRPAHRPEPGGAGGTGPAAGPVAETRGQAEPATRGAGDPS